MEEEDHSFQNNPPKRIKQRPCCVQGCTDFSSKRHRFPKNNRRLLRAWIKAVRPKHWDVLTATEIYDRYLVCNAHFSREDCVPGTVRGLRINAVPTINLPVGQDIEVRDDLFENTVMSIDCDSSSMGIDLITLPDPILSQNYSLTNISEQENRPMSASFTDLGNTFACMPV
ncbi:uncharacterized protein LOC126743711 [Anthonomus grandis grandis]|uniref:uncharacterized protein LOC126743711 n=1 Tax=Anthonomus grandis grandis TaxID=2921223 RepID=UPI002165CD36|nr:uncharacterized protein LOC126743711 [Anthonomus grandis grandis]